MGRHRTSHSLELSIHGDEQEKHRILLEHNLQSVALSDLHLSDASDVEYPRHLDHSRGIADQFTSIEYRAEDSDGPSLAHRWSYRSLDDDPAVRVYTGGETMSTAAHHASVVTLTAGLNGPGARRRDISMSGAEYDPERPLDGIIAGTNTRFSVLEDVSSRKYPHPSTITFDPLVVDDTAELDQVLASGRAGLATPPSLAALRSPKFSEEQSAMFIPAVANISPVRSPLSSGESSSSSSSGRNSPRPKLSDALKRVDFSPKRPRNNPGMYSPKLEARVPSRLRHEATHTSKHSEVPPDQHKTHAPIPSMPHLQSSIHPPSPPSLSYLEPDPTSKPKEKLGAAKSSHGHGKQSVASDVPSHDWRAPEVQVQPPTPGSSAGRSLFTSMARGLARDIGDASSTAAPVQSTAERRPSRKKPRRDSPEDKRALLQPDTLDELQENQLPRLKDGRTHERTKLHIPNASAEASGFQSRPIQLPDVTGLTSAVATPARPTHTYKPYPHDKPNEEQARLIASLNHVQAKLSRLEQENGISRRRVRELELELDRCKGEVAKERTRVLEREKADQGMDHEQHRQRRTAREMDPIRPEPGQQKGKHVRMAMDEDAFGDARYREVVEEKKALEALTSTLRTHLARLTSELASHQHLLTELRLAQEADIRDRRAMKMQLGDVELLKMEVERLSGEVEVLRNVVEEGLRERRRDGIDSESGSDDGDISEGFDALDAKSEDPGVVEVDTSYRPEHDVSNKEEEEEDTASMSMSIATPSPSPSIQLPHIADKTSRTDAATMASESNPVVSRPYLNSEELEQISGEISSRRSERAERSVSRGGSACTSRRGSPNTSVSSHRDTTTRRSPAASPRIGSPSPVPRPAAPTPAHASRQAGLSRPSQCQGVEPQSSAAYPEIRGSRVEQMFLSAPEHDAKTCTVCNRPNKAQTTDGDLPIWLKSRKFDYQGSRYHAASSEPSSAHPPQTVLARVLRELEDDFTHYKGIYIELAEQYAIMDAASNSAKRNMLAQHLREVIDILEQKGDQIASLYGLLRFQDKSVLEPLQPPRTSSPPPRREALKKHSTIS